MKNLLFIVCILLGIELNAQLLPKHNEFTELGFSFDIPDGWSAEQNGEIIMMGHQTIAGLMIMSTNEASSAEELKNEAMKGLIDEGVNLVAIGDFKIENNNKVTGNYKGVWDGAEVTCYAVGLINSQGIGINILVVTSTEMFTDIHEKEAQKLSQSVTFFPPKVAEQSELWRNKLVPSLVKYMNSSYDTDYSGGSSGTSTTKSITLCSNGYFSYYFNDEVSYTAGDGVGGESGFGHANSNDSSEGKFDIKTVGNETYLILNFEDGKVYEYSLFRNSEGHTLLNGTRYFVVETEYCN